jgi:hypothetical protein
MRRERAAGARAAEMGFDGGPVMAVVLAGQSMSAPVEALSSLYCVSRRRKCCRITPRVQCLSRERVS